MLEREGKGKAETWAHKPVMEDKGRLCFTLFIPSTNKRLITVLSLNCKICFVCSTSNFFFLHVTKLPLFLKNSFCWCSDQVFKPRWNLCNSRDYRSTHAVNFDTSEAHTKTFLYSKDKSWLYKLLCSEVLVCTNKLIKIKIKYMNIYKNKSLGYLSSLDKKY